MGATVPEHIMQLGLGFCAPKALLSAVELRVFSALEWCFRAGEVTVGRELVASSAGMFLDLYLVSECYAWVNRIN